MAVVIKSKGLQFLGKLGGTAPGMIAALKDYGVTLSLGHKNFTFYSAKGVVLSSGDFMVPGTELLSPAAPFYAKKTAREMVAAAAQKALLAVQGTAAVAAVAEAVLTSPVQAVAVEASPAVAVEANPASVFQGAQVVPVAQVIPLRDATKMYQRVRGTTSGSVYVVVALNDAIRIAAKVTGTNLAIRAEPSFANPFLPADVVRLKAQSIEFKQSYASGHFECGKVSVARMLGAVLVGLGISFDTPLPDVELVIAASK